MTIMQEIERIETESKKTFRQVIAFILTFLCLLAVAGWASYETPAQKQYRIINCTGAGCHTYIVPPFSAGCNR